MPRARRHQWSADGQEEAPRPSRSARKRASLALQDLGAELARLPLPEMRALNLPPDLAAALELYARIGDHEGRRRQLQFIGRLMREVDPEPVRAALEARQAKTAAAGAALHLAEQWRHRLLAAPEAELDSLLGALPWKPEGKKRPTLRPTPRGLCSAHCAAGSTWSGTRKFFDANPARNA